ncbi:MAG TPA: TIM-barrel domain-containing protein [Vicinamibacterales bacterium]|jgi:alpha-D-xyloside xylohydrolase
MLQFAAGAIALAAGFSQGAARTDGVERVADGIRLRTAAGVVTLHVETEAIVRVTFAKRPDFRADDMVVVGPKGAAPVWKTASSASTVTLTTARLRVTIARADGAVAFADASGHPILAEAADGHRLTAAEVQGEQTFHVQQVWKANDDESIYGLGQRQEGKLDIKGYDLDLWQRNTVVELPMFVSSRGYGILWDNTAPSKFGDIAPFEALPATADRVTAPVTGDYQFQTYSNGETKVWLDGVLRIDHYKQNWATEYDQFKVHLEAGRTYPLKVTNTGGTTLELRWKKPVAQATSMWSEVGDGVDYYFIYGPEIDQVIAGYRALTGQASMLPAWAFGFWQSKNKYNTQDEILKTVAEFRRRRIPMDTIVQDWQYWPIDRWGDHEFEASRYPDPDAMIKGIHDAHAHFMISVWGKFYPTTRNYKAMDAIHALYPTTATDHVKDWLNREYSFYDTFNAPARALFWDQVNRALFRRGVDAWWMDATEPDLVQPSPPTLESTRRFIDRTAVGTASRVMSAYPLMNSKAVYDGQRSTAPDQRVFILTRSGFAGIQRYATVTWSGDITSTFQTLRKQITAGLGFSIAGDPYWTTDTGGYTMDRRFAQAKDGDALDEWRELNARWFQYSTFSPILRVHGTDRPREMWNLGDESTDVYKTELAFDKLRYALFPYIYSVAGAVTQDGATLMRPLVMDFRADTRARDVTDEYMFGPAFLVNPVTEYKARTRPVYLPAGTAWYDFWTGTRTAGGQAITADAPVSRLPLYVRAGSIVPFGPDQQYIGEAPDAPITLHVYAGADGRFSLYEDDGKSYGYERGEFARIPIAWNDATRTLTIGARTGSYPGMPATRTFTVVLVTPQSAVGYGAGGTNPIAYTGAAVSTRVR